MTRGPAEMSAFNVLPDHSAAPREFCDAATAQSSPIPAWIVGPWTHNTWFSTLVFHSGAQEGPEGGQPDPAGGLEGALNLKW